MYGLIKRDLFSVSVGMGLINAVRRKTSSRASRRNRKAPGSGLCYHALSAQLRRIELLEERIAMATQTLGSLEFLYDGTPTQAVLSGTTSSPVQIGLIPGQNEVFVPLLNLVGNMTLTQSSTAPSFSVNGDIYTNFGGLDLNIDLLGGLNNATFDVNELTGAGMPVCTTLSEIASLAGGQLGIQCIQVNRNGDTNSPQIELKGDLGITGVAGLSVDLCSNGSEITGVSGQFSANSNITFGSLAFSSQNLGLTWTPGQLSLWGATSANIGSGRVSGSFGTQASPGIEISNGSLTTANLGISGSFIEDGIAFSAKSLRMNYDSASNGNYIWRMTGLAGFSLDGNAVDVALGGGSSSGLVVTNGALTNLDMLVTSNLTVDSLTFQTSSLRLMDNVGTGTFQITGATSFALGNDILNVNFIGNYGLLIVNGSIGSIDASINGNISVGSLSVVPSNLTLNYQPGQTYITGSASFILDSDNISVNFLGENGLEIVDGQISAVDVSINSNLNIGGLTFQANQLELQYDGDLTTITGSAGFNLGTDSLNVDFMKKNGLVIANGEVASIDAEITGNFSLAGASFFTQNLTLAYISGGSTKILGVAGFQLTPADYANVSFNAPDGLSIVNGSVSSMNASLNGSVTLGGLTTIISNMTLTYSPSIGDSPESLGLSGNILAEFGNEAANDQNCITLSLNQVGNMPGLLIQDASLAALNASFIGNISVFGCKISVPADNPLSISYNKSQNQYEFSGAIGFSNTDCTFNTGTNKNLTAILGSLAKPGLILQGGDLSYLNVSLNGSFSLFDINTSINNLNLIYTSANGTLDIIGGLGVSLGSGIASSFTLTDGGMVIDTQTGQVQVDGFTANLADVNLGFLTIENFYISYTSSNSQWNANLAVQFPLGWSVNATLQLDNGKINDIGLTYIAGTNEGIPVGETGLFVTSISTTIDNLDQQSDLTISGSIGLTYGKQISVAGYTGAIVAATGNFLIDPNGMTLDANVSMLGGLATGTGNLTLDWASGQYSLSVSEDILDETFVIDADIQFDSTGDLLITAMAEVNVPSHMPVIGGDNLGSINFALKYLYNNGSPTFFAAAWTTVHVWFIHETVGFEWNDGFSFLGSDGVSDIQAQLSLPSPAFGQNPMGSGQYNSVQWANINTIPTSSGTTNSQGTALTVLPGTSTISLQGQTAYNWGTNLALVTSNNGGTIWTSLGNFPAGVTEIVDLNGGSINLDQLNGTMPSFPINDMTISAVYDGSRLLGYNLLSGGEIFGFIPNPSGSSSYTPALAYMTVTTAPLQPGNSASAYQYNVVIQSIGYINQNLPCNSFYLESYYSPSYPNAVSAISHAKNSTIYTQPIISTFGVGNALLPTNNPAYVVNSSYLEAIDTGDSYTTANLPQLMGYYSSDLNSIITPGLYYQVKGVWQIAATSTAFTPSTMGVNQNALVWTWRDGYTPPSGATYKFGFIESVPAGAPFGTSQSIFLNDSTGNWVYSADSGINPLNFGRFPVVAQAGAGNSLISRGNIDQYVGEVYINVQQTFQADDLPSSFSYYAENNNALTPLLFGIGANGKYQLAAIGQSLQTTNINGNNSSQLVWKSWINNNPGPVLGTMYAVGFSDRQFITQNGTTSQNTFSGTIPYDTSSSTFAYTDSPNSLGTLSLGQSFSTSGSADYRLNVGRAYSAVFFSGSQASSNKIMVIGNVSPTLANSSEIEYFVNSDSSSTGGRLIYRSNLASGGLNINSSTGNFTALFDPTMVTLPPGADYF